MGFSLVFMRIDSTPDGPVTIDPDHQGLEDFLKRRGLHMRMGPPFGAPGQRGSSATLVNEDGSDLILDGRLVDLDLHDVLPQDTAMSASLGHARMGPEECGFIYDLCVSAGFLILNPQGCPTLLVPAGTHTPEQLKGAAWEPESPEEVLHIGSADELQAALAGGVEDFLQWRQHAFAHLHGHAQGAQGTAGAEQG